MTSTTCRSQMEDAPPPWIACERCRSLSYRRKLEREMWVCPARGQYLRLLAAQRMRMLLDLGSVRLLTPKFTVCDPLDFTDTRDYHERLVLAQEATRLKDAVLIAAGAIDGQPVVVAVMNFAFMGGSLGVTAGEGIVTAAEYALSVRAPLLLVTASGGARMQEGPRVIEQTISECLPQGFQTAEFLFEQGLVDNVRPCSGLRAALAILLAAANRRTAVARRSMPAIDPT